MMNRLSFVTALLLSAGSLWAEQRYPVTGLVLRTDAPHRSFEASCTAIPNYMEAMAMSFSVKDEKELRGIEPSMVVEFTLVVTDTDSYAENIRIHRYASMEQEPVEVRNLQLLAGSGRANGGPPLLTLGQTVPDFTLTDQMGQKVSLSQFTGKVVVAAFIYTSCPLPNYCLRLSNNLGRLQKRFADRLGKDLVLLSVTMDPVHDTPDVLAKYAATWKANPQFWHFLTGSPDAVRALCNQFGVDYWSGEGSLTHSLHTIVIERNQHLAANFEGNEFTAEQLGDYVETLVGKKE
jgi:protein SCO1/2